MSVTLRKRKNSDGTISLRLDIYHNGKHRIETLKHLQLEKPSSVLERENNKVRMKQAEAIKLNRATELESKNYNIISEAGKRTEVTVWMQSYIDTYTKKDKRNLQGALNRFIKFLSITKNTGITFGELNHNPLLIEEFIDYLEKTSEGEGARSYYARFKKMLRYAFRKGIMKDNVLDKVEKKATGEAKKKDFLTIDEIRLLLNTPVRSEEVKRAAIFSSVTGLSWIDIYNLTWDKIKMDARKLVLVREKLKRKNKAVTIHLNDTAMGLLKDADRELERVFPIPSHDGCNKTLKNWVKRAKIDKHITWHNLRHSFGTNLTIKNVDIYKTSQQMGHGSVSQTQRYVMAAAEYLDTSTDTLNL